MATRRDSLNNTIAASKMLSGATRSPFKRDSVTIKRLIVLVPNRGINSSALARKVLNLAKPCHINVVYLCLSGAGAGEDGDARLRLATLISMTRDEDVHIDVAVEPDDNWVRAVYRHWQPGDAVICMAEQSVVLQGTNQQPLCHAIEYLLHVPVYVVTGMYVGQRQRRGHESTWSRTMNHWLYQLLLLAVIVGCFFCVQLRITFLPGGLVRTGLLYASGMAEASVIGAWNALRH